VTGCAACGDEISAEITGPVTRTVTVSSVGVTGYSQGGPYCPACDDNLSHLNALFYGTRDGFAFCGCGSPGAAYATVRDILAACPLHRQPGLRTAMTEDDATSGFWYLTLYTIDRAGLIEHGGSIGGSWLTPKGAHYLPLMQRYTWDQIEDTGLPHGGDGCTPACGHWRASRSEYALDRDVADWNARNSDATA
jgi:hypothetical protein